MLLLPTAGLPTRTDPFRLRNTPKFSASDFFVIVTFVMVITEPLVQTRS